jgi:hypothetical protein
MKQGELVTVNFGERNSSSNTYKIARAFAGEAFLEHPLASDCFILRKEEELDKTIPNLKTPQDRCLDYLFKYKKYLNYDQQCEAEALFFFFVVKRKLAGSQKNHLSQLCGRIAAVYCDNDLSIAIRTVNENLALLDPFNRNWYNNFERVHGFFSGKKEPWSDPQKNSIFNIAGFVLAQLEA